MATTRKELAILLSAQDNTRAAFNSVDQKMKSMSNAAKKLSGVLATLGVGLGAGELIRDLVNVNVEFDRLQASLVTVTGSEEKAQAAFDRIKSFAATTPYQIDEVTEAFIKMKALGLNASEDALRSYGDTASAMGKSLNQMIEAVADASTGEFERLKEFGIKAKQQGDQVSFTFQGVTTTIGKNAKEIEAYLQGIGNTKFAGGMARQMDTLGGAISNLSDSWKNMLAAIGDAGATNAAVNNINRINNGLRELTDFVANDTASQIARRVKEIANLKKQIDDIKSDKDPFGNFLGGLFGVDNVQNRLDQIAKLESEIRELRSKLPTTMGGAAALAKALAEREEGVEERPYTTLADYGDAIQRANNSTFYDETAKRYGKTDALSMDEFNRKRAQLKQAEEAAAAELEQLRVGLYTQNEAIQAAYDDRMTIIQQALVAEQLTKEEAAELEKKAAQKREDELTAIKKKGEESRNQVTLQGWQTGLSMANQFIGVLASTQDQSNKKSFEKYKKFAEAQAAISGILGIMSVWGDQSINNVYAKIAMSAVIAGMTAVQEAKISSMSYQGARAAGGSVLDGSTYLVGERGPELLTMGENGRIIPNHQLGGNQVQNIAPTIVFNMSAGLSGTVQAELQRAMPYMVAQTKKAVVAAAYEGGAMSRAVGRMR